ncbi:MAG TPA: type II toxin-antitoxin system death-on-curing family toxin [Phycisphaerae bacterium]|nr:type II toxin-antitoxin system death-on-curing family toxin [Phycisphaerae bacterium]
MTPSPRFLSLEDVLTLHAIAIADQAGDATLRDRAALESAVAQPQQQVGGQYLHQDIPAMAAAYAFHVARNHPFLDGNKRAATAAMIAFLSDNGWAFNAAADEAEPVIRQMAAGSLDKSAFTEWLRQNMHEKPKMELREFFEKADGDMLWEKMKAIVAPYDSPTGKEEIYRTWQEAKTPIPAIARFDQWAEEARRRNDEQACKYWTDRIYVLIALYRVAEDMGYEW